MKIAWSKIYAHPLPQGHRFPMEKYDLLYEQLIYEGLISESQVIKPKPLENDVIALTHSIEYIHKLETGNLTRAEERKTGFPYSALLLQREKTIMNGTLLCSKYAKDNGAALNVAGGTHHAFKDRGEGFCLYNDQAIAASYLLDMNFAKKILIIDLDVHQGNGTASIFENDHRVFTFSMHGKSNYPIHKENSDLDIELKDGINDGEYLSILEPNLNKVFQITEPDFVFFQSGVDVLASDKLGKLGLTIQGCKERDRMVIETCFKKNLPLTVSMGGGYSPQIKDIIEAHSNTFRLVYEYYG
jgi:acetoin utilization deacetylase AcuC-like enzyme